MNSLIGCDDCEDDGDGDGDDCGGDNIDNNFDEFVPFDFGDSEQESHRRSAMHAGKRKRSGSCSWGYLTPRNRRSTN